MALRTDLVGNSYVRLDAAPWLVRYSPSGLAESLKIRSDLSSLSDFGLMDDGTVMLATALNGAVRGVQLEHLDGAGELLSSTVLPAAPAEWADFKGMATTPGGRVYLAMLVSYPDEPLFRIEVYQIDAAGVVASTPVSSRFHTDFEMEVTRIAADNAGNIVYGGPNDSAEVTVAGQYHELVSNFGVLGALGSDRRGGWFASTGFGERPFAYTLYRFSASGDQLWDARQTFTPALGMGADHQTAATVLVDSFVIAVPFGQLGDLGHAARYTMDGQVVQGLFDGTPPGPSLVAEVGAYAATFLTQDAGEYTLTRLDFAPLASSPGAEGAACSVDVECTSGVCCVPWGPGLGTCAPGTTCAPGMRCKSDEICGNGICAKPSDGTDGACVAACATSDDCPNSTFCVAGSCLSSCTPPAPCDIEAMDCIQHTNTEAIDVFVCSYP